MGCFQFMQGKYSYIFRQVDVPNQLGQARAEDKIQHWKQRYTFQGSGTSPAKIGGIYFVNK